MSPLRPEEIEKRLREAEAPKPPADLLARLRDGIPERPVVVAFRGEAEGSGDAPGASPRHRGRWLLAASVAVALIGGSLAWRVAQRWEASATSTAGEAVTQEEGAAELPAGDLMLAGKAGAQGQIAGVPEADASDEAVAELETERLGTSSPDPRRDPLVALAEPASPPSVRPAVPGEVAEESTPSGPLLQPPARTRPASPPQPDAAADRSAEVRTASRDPYVAMQMRLDPSISGPAPEAYRSAAPSTGGTTEPNDLPYGDMFFQSYGVNPFIDTEDDNLSTFGLDVDTGSYTLARGYIERGHLPPAEAIRVEEMVNFFDYGDPAPSQGDFAVTAEGAPTPFAEGPRYRLLRFNIRGRDVAAADRAPATLVFVVDVSGSMERDDRLGLVKRSLGLLLDQLRSDDRVGLVVYGDRGQVLLEPSGDLEAIRSAISWLRPGGSTNAEEGLLLGYELVERHLRSGAIHRVVLCSDGVANVGRTGPESILARVGAAAGRGIELTTIGFGMGNYNDVLMEQLADRGDGGYAYVDTLDEARRVLVEELTGTLQTIAREARVQVEFDPRAVSRYRLLGYENRDIADERFRDDTVDAGEIGAGHGVTALYEIKLQEAARPEDVLATVRLRYHSVAAGETVETATSLRLGDLAGSWESASPRLRLASLVAEHAEILRRSYWAREGDLEDVFRRSQSVAGEFPGDIDVTELAGLIGRAARLASERTEILALDDR